MLLLPPGRRCLRVQDGRGAGEKTYRILRQNSRGGNILTSPVCPTRRYPHGPDWPSGIRPAGFAGSRQTVFSVTAAE